MTSTFPAPCSSDRDAGIFYYDRPSGRIERETVYAEAGVRWCYQSWLGRLLSRAVLARAWPSRLYGIYQDSRFSRRKIGPFVRALGIDTGECVRPLDEFASFNDFFTRRLRSEARPIDPDPDTLTSPADGRVWAVQRIEQDSVLPIKGRAFSVHELLGGEERAAPFRGGAAVCVRLCPADYHRFHFPDDGTPRETWRIAGAYHSVNPHALASGLSIFDRNAREITLFDSASFGRIALVDVGAMFVGRIVQTFTPGQPVRRGAEQGYFTFGASTTVMLLGPGRVVLDADLLEQTHAGLETRLLMGTRIGRRQGVD